MHKLIYTEPLTLFGSWTCSAFSLLLRWKARLPSGILVLWFLNNPSFFCCCCCSCCPPGAIDKAKALPKWPGWICKAIGGFPYLAVQEQADKDLSGLVKERHFPKSTSGYGAMLQWVLLGLRAVEPRVASYSFLLQTGLTCSPRTEGQHYPGKHCTRVPGWQGRGLCKPWLKELVILSTLALPPFEASVVFCEGEL